VLFSELKARVRNIYEAPDGKILLLLDGPDGRIMKISK
jgi:glucose/arabinose dehydrogenase